MSAQEVSETAPNSSEPNPEEPQIIMKETIEEISEITEDDRKKFCEMILNGRTDEVTAKKFHEFIKYVPSWSQEKNYEQEFDPKVIISYIAAQSSDKTVMDIDISMLIKLGIERGNDLEKISISSPEFKLELKRLRLKYELVSKAKSSKTAVTLSRVCESVPILTCLYLKNEAENPIVSFELMETICKNYPRVMMTSAFAYLIPNKEDEFCLFLKKAHLLHQYQFFAKMSQESHPSSSVDDENEFISKVYVNTQAAINGSHMEYDVQIKFLKEHELIVEGENEITVTEEVLEAVKLWDEKERQHEIDQRYSDYEDDYCYC
ncbi:uncharacterized protein LOC111028928 [Myzus persicae]|uniref:uncharacterized protein LOC111028928 n=1 Tax=Myzus persicae TaxID=13164 RepID=UPI000B932125|nr:uncharacterized protein LOC111028928 [Myzus persicae]